MPVSQVKEIGPNIRTNLLRSFSLSKRLHHPWWLQHRRHVRERYFRFRILNKYHYLSIPHLHIEHQ